MKAILEFEAPESCHDCDLAMWNGSNHWCQIRPIRIEQFDASISPDCPLRIEKEEHCEMCCEQRSETQEGCGNFNVLSKADRLRLTYKFIYCPYCARKLEEK